MQGSGFIMQQPRYSAFLLLRIHIRNTSYIIYYILTRCEIYPIVIRENDIYGLFIFLKAWKMNKFIDECINNSSYHSTTFFIYFSPSFLPSTRISVGNKLFREMVKLLPLLPIYVFTLSLAIFRMHAQGVHVIMLFFKIF